MITVDRINHTILSLVICSTLILITVVYFQYVQGLEPCQLCIWQRLPHILAATIGSLILIKPELKKVGALFALISIFLGTVLAGYHVGIEASLWPGPQNCSGLSTLSELTPELFLQKILTEKVIQCNEITWAFLNISMAGWNFIISILLSGLWACVSFSAVKQPSPFKT